MRCTQFSSFEEYQNALKSIVSNEDAIRAENDGNSVADQEAARRTGKLLASAVTEPLTNIKEEIALLANKPVHTVHFEPELEKLGFAIERWNQTGLPGGIVVEEAHQLNEHLRRLKVGEPDSETPRLAKGLLEKGEQLRAELEEAYDYMRKRSVYDKVAEPLNNGDEGIYQNLPLESLPSGISSELSSLSSSPSSSSDSFVTDKSSMSRKQELPAPPTPEVLEKARKNLVGHKLKNATKEDLTQSIQGHKVEVKKLQEELKVAKSPAERAKIKAQVRNASRRLQTRVNNYKDRFGNLPAQLTSSALARPLHDEIVAKAKNFQEEEKEVREIAERDGLENLEGLMIEAFENPKVTEDSRLFAETALQYLKEVVPGYKRPKRKEKARPAQGLVARSRAEGSDSVRTGANIMKGGVPDSPSEVEARAHREMVANIKKNLKPVGNATGAGFGRRTGAGFGRRTVQHKIEGGKFGKLTINMKKLPQLRLVAKRGRHKMIDEDIPHELYELLTKKYDSRKKYPAKAIRMYKKLSELAEVPVANAQSKKHKMTTLRKNKLLKKIKVLIGSRQSGNMSPDIVEEATEILDELLDLKAIDRNEYIRLSRSLV